MQVHLGGQVDAIVFSAGIGEHSAPVRASVCEGLEALGVEIDATRNDRAGGRIAEISASVSRLRVFVIATDEELLIARDTVAVAGLSPDQDTRGSKSTEDGSSGRDARGLL